MSSWDWGVDWGDGHEGGVVATASRQVEDLPWLLEIEMDKPDRDEPIRVREVRFVPMSEEHLVGTDLFKRLRLNAALRDLERSMRRWGPHMLPRSWLDNMSLAKRPGRAGRDDLFYAEWAERYVEALARAPRSPLALLTQENPGHSEAQLRAVLNKARGRELLTPAPSGRAGGELTERARSVLEER